MGMQAKKIIKVKVLDNIIGVKTKASQENLMRKCPLRPTDKGCRG